MSVMWTASKISSEIYIGQHSQDIKIFMEKHIYIVIMSIVVDNDKVLKCKLKSANFNYQFLYNFLVASLCFWFIPNMFLYNFNYTSDIKNQRFKNYQ